jgi:hypothetical protein
MVFWRRREGEGGLVGEILRRRGLLARRRGRGE